MTVLTKAQKEREIAFHLLKLSESIQEAVCEIYDGRATSLSLAYAIGKIAAITKRIEKLRGYERLEGFERGRGSKAEVN